LEFLGIIVLPLVLAFANAAGIGGGGIIVPFVIVFWSYGTKEAIAISTFSLFVSTVVRYIYNWKQMHPEKDSIVIDYGIATICSPLIMLGSLFGVFLSVIIPAVIITAILTALLIFISVNTYLKFRKTYC